MTTTDPPAAEPAAPLLAPEPRRRRVREGVLIAGLLALAVLAVVLGTRGGSGSRQPVGASPSSSVTGLTPIELARKHAITDLLARRSAAILHRDRAVFAATLDPDNARFRRSQLAMFDNLVKIPFARWSYSFSATTTPLQEKPLRNYDVPAFAPDSFSESYSIAGFDPKPTELTMYPTFVERSGRWYLASFSDEEAIDEESDTQIWDYGPIDVLRRPGVIVMGPTPDQGELRKAADAIEVAIPRVTAVWGRRWSRRVVVQLPETLKEMGAITDDGGDLHRIAALTTSETSATAGFVPVGDRVTLNPVVWPQTSTIGAEVILTHELTHVASRDDTSGATPKWLSEGLADYVGYLALDLPATDLAGDLTRLVQDGRPPRRLPPNEAFDGANPHIGLAYQSGWMACRYIVARYGLAKMLRFYRMVGRSVFGPDQAVQHAMHAVLQTSPGRFVAAWRQYVKQQL